MSGHNKVSNTFSNSSIADYFMFDLLPDEDLEALPGIHSINRAIISLKEQINNGQRNPKKQACAYLGFRLISYSGIPTVLNFVSLVLSGILFLITLPIRLCNERLNRWCWVRLQGSLGFFMQSLFDLTCDFRQVTGVCCTPGSLYRDI